MHKYWNIHPMRDFHLKDEFGVHEIKIGELLEAGLSFEAIHGCKVTLEELARAGLNPDNMCLFNFRFYQWKMLGFKASHAKCMSSSQVEATFGIPKHILEASFLQE